MNMSYKNKRYLSGYALARKQRGMSFMGVFAIVAICVFIGMVAFKIGPNYMEFMTVKTIAKDLTKKPDLLKSGKSKVIKHINQAYQTNNLWDLKAEDTIDLKKDGRLGYSVTVNYEKRTNLFANVDVVTVFKKAMNE